MSRFFPQRPWPRRWLLAASAVFLLAMAVHAWPGMRARTWSPTGGAQWIWKQTGHKDYQPTAFYAIRDFWLEAPPSRARLLVAADEEYVLTLNGQRIGAGAYQHGAPLDAYEVGPLLLAGGNRLVAELRSSRGTGGFLASLVDEATGRHLVGSDEGWRIFPRHELGLVRGWLPIGGGERAISWGYPPVGRWGAPEPGRPSPPQGQPAGPPLPAVTVLPVPAGLGSSEARRPGSPVLYDWGRRVSGRLTLDLPPGQKLGMGLLFVGDQPPDPLRDQPAGSVLILPGRRDWLDSRPRSFRYVLLMGLARPARAAVLPEAVPPARPAEDGKVFGLEGPPLRTPVEDKVWSELQRLPGVAGRKEL